MVAVPRIFSSAADTGSRHTTNSPAVNPAPANPAETPPPAPSAPAPNPATGSGGTLPAPAQPIQQPPVYRLHGSKPEIIHMVKGAVISFPLHLPSFRQPVTSPAREHTLTYIGQWIESKIRKFIIIEIYPYHCIVLPLYSFGGQGLANRENKDEFIAARDAAEGVPIATESESPHGAISIERLREWRESNPNNNLQDPHYIHPSSYVHIAEPQYFNFGWPCVREGCVRNDDLKKLSELYHARCPVEHVTAGFTVVRPRGAAAPAPPHTPMAREFRGANRGDFHLGRGRGWRRLGG